MASSQYTADHLYIATYKQIWKDVRGILGDMPHLVNETYRNMTSLHRIMLLNAPEDIVLDSLHFVRKEVLDDVEGTPLDRCIIHYLAEYGHTTSLSLALDKSSRHLNLQDKFGDTPYHLLLEGNHSFRVHIETLQVLLNAGADSDIKNLKNLTPVDVYTRNECIKYDDKNKVDQKNKILELIRTKQFFKGNTVPIEILARGTKAVKAFNQALTDGKIEVHQGRTFLLGLEGVGKTSTINSFLRRDFNPDEGITDAMATTTVCTMGSQDELHWKEPACGHPGLSNIYDKTMADSIAKQLLKKEMNEGTWEVPMEQNELLPDIKKAKGTSSEKQGQTSLEDLGQSIKRQRTNFETPPTEEVPEHIASQVEKKMNEIKFTREATSEWQTSGNEFIMNIWDFGGQPIYHGIQRIFLASFAVFCVVFNLKDDLDAPAKVIDPTTGDMYNHRMTNLQFILYWIRSVFTNSRPRHSSPVLLVGTHFYSLEGTEEERKKKAETIFYKIRQAMEGKPYENMVFQTFFTIENSVPFSKSNASELMKQILILAKKMIRCLPLKWLLVQQEIQKFKRNHTYLPTNEILALIERCGVTDDSKSVLLDYLHDIGEILYFPDDEDLQNIIVLDLMRIVDMFKTIITVKDPQLIEQQLKDAWKLLDSGILQEPLLRHLWTKFHLSDKEFEFFVSLMQKFGLMCEKKGSERIFYVLSCLKPERVDSSPIEGYKNCAISIFHDFGGYLPDDLFQRGVTKFIEKFQIKESKAKLSYEHVELDLDELHRVVLDVTTIKHRRMFQTTIIIKRIPSGMPAEELEPLPNVCKQVLSFLERELRVFSQRGARGVELKKYIACECSQDIRDAHMHAVSNFDMDVLPCGSYGVARYRRLFGENIQAILKSDPPVNKPEGFVDDAIIATVSDGLNLSWRRFGVRLGLSWSKVNEYNDDKIETHKAENMIKYWRNLNNECHQLKVLCTALRHHGLTILAECFYTGDIVDEHLANKGQRQSISVCFDDQDLSFICDNLGSEWRRLGVRLGLKWTEIDRIAANNRHTEDNIMDLLVTWRNKESTNQISTMINALRQHKRVWLAERVRERHGFELKDSTTHQRPIGLPEYLDDQDLLYICDKLGRDWRTLGVRLGLGWSDINGIAANKDRSIKDSIMELLVTWRDGESKNHVAIMVNALRQHKRDCLAKYVCEMHCSKNELELASIHISLFQVSRHPRPLKGRLADIDLLFIAERMRDDWRDFGHYLGLRRSEIFHCEKNFEPSVVDAIIEMLVKWRERQKAESGHLEKMSKILDKFEGRDILEELLVYYEYRVDPQDKSC